MARRKSIPKNSSLQRDTPNKRRSFPKLVGRASSFKILPPDQLNEQYYLGRLVLGRTNNVVPEEWNACKVSFAHRPDSECFILKLVFNNDNVVIANTNNGETYIKDLISSKVFAFGFEVDGECLIARLYINRLPLLQFNASIGNILKIVFAEMLNTELTSEEEDRGCDDPTESDNLTHFYKNIKEVQARTCIKSDTIEVQHPLLKLLLRPYQQEAVRWMLSREQIPKNKEILHPLFEEVKLPSGTIVYYNKHTGYVDNIKPVVSNIGTGGILADEMGLGKTVEVLACILLSPKPNDLPKSTNALESPTVLMKSKKRKFKAIQDTPYNELNISKMPKKSELRLSLNLWYSQKLLDVTVNKPKVVKNEKEAYCICGNVNITESTVQCVDCLKYQHGSCLGYKTTFGEYRCPTCWSEQSLLNSKATLIVCPVSLREQWCAEICKHVSGLRIFEYEGTKATPVYPVEFLDYDVVITTYAVLQSELRLTESTKVCNLRHSRRYSAPGSPLSRIYWWRLCLDEAQMVEVPGSMMATMAKKLSAQHRWAVTGTPIVREISGLYGLIDYLQLEPYSEYETWKYMLYLPYRLGKTDLMFNFLAQVLWRRCKKEVIDQIGIPPQTLVEYPLEFSAVESFFYRKEHNMSANVFKTNVRTSEIDKHDLLSSLDKTMFTIIMAPLLNLRQSCNSAGAVRGRYLATHKQVTSIKDLLNALITKNMNFCEENLRMLVSALNGLAGIALLSNNQERAVNEYRKVLTLASRFNAEDAKKGLTVDKLQLIHTMFNLAQVLQTTSPVVPTLRDSTLQTDCLKLQDKYLEKYVNQCLSTFEESEACSTTIGRLEEKFLLQRGQWYSALIEWISINGLFHDLAQRIFNAFSNASLENLPRFSDERDLLYLITIWDEDIFKLRKKTKNLLSKLYEYKNGKLIISDQLVQSAMGCHLRPESNSKSVKQICLLCKVSRQMRKYEAKLFEMTQKESNDDEDISNKGSWKLTWAEIVFKALLALAKSRNADNEIINDGEIYTNLLDTMKREFKQKRKFWTYLHQQINALDEINMCKVRINFKVPGENKKESTTDKILKQLSTVLSNRAEFIHYIEPHELDFQESLLNSEELRNTAELEKNIGTYKYLQTLRCQQYAGQNPDPCPICKNELQNHWNILPCGHSYCLECIDELLKKVCLRPNVTCPICRQTHRVLDISYIRTNVENDNTNDEFRIKGDYSTKIEAIVKLVINLKNEDSDVKVLIFSTWVEILSIIRDALKVNDVVCEVMFSSDVKKSVSNFKNPSKNVTALLLPIRLGSKGLNLIEATHVILVEPLLNPGDELQAIGRVHRIGQTKPTTVHKFIVKHTIEENIHRAIAANTLMWDSDKYTVGQLIDLFVTNEVPIEV